MKRTLYIFILFFSITAFSQSMDQSITAINVYPNPFNDRTTISFKSPTNTSILFTVQNLLGNVVASKEILVTQGNNTIPFHRNHLASGIYIYTLKTKSSLISKRFVIK